MNPKVKQKKVSAKRTKKAKPVLPKSSPSTSSRGCNSDGGTGPPGTFNTTGKDVSWADDAAAQADTDPAGDTAGRSPFGLSYVQAVRAQSVETSVKSMERTSTAAAEAAAAASIALAGAASRATSSAASSLQHGRSTKKSLRLAGKKKSSHMPEVTSADAVEQLAEELMVDD